MGQQVLNSWKEIAHYMGRSVRAVQRWERELGLPVHRSNRGRGTVMATTEEIDEWVRSTEMRQPPEDAA